MKRIHFRVDDWLYERFKAYDLSIQECVERVCKKISKGQIKAVIIEGRLKHMITAKLPEKYLGISPEMIRLGLYAVFQNMQPIEPRIDPDDKNKKYVVELT